MEEKTFKPVPDVECLKYHGTPEKPDIKIFVSHRIDLDSETIDNPLYIPVRCGAVYDERENVDMLGDDTGDNISDRKFGLCELTVQYWAWKNIRADYYGFCTYKQYLSLSDETFEETPYGTVCDPSLRRDIIRKKYQVTERRLQDLLNQNDVILVEKTPISQLREIQDFKSVKETKDILDIFEATLVTPKPTDILGEIIKTQYPHLYSTYEKYMADSQILLYYAYVMKADIFHEFCDFEFSIIARLEHKLKKQSYGELRVTAFQDIRNILLAIFIDYKQKSEGCKVLTKQLVDFESTYPECEIFPAFSENNIAIMTMSSNEYAPYLGVYLKSLIAAATSENNYDILIFERNISPRNKRLILSLCEDVDNVSIRFYNMNAQMADIKFFVAAAHFAVEAYYRLLLPWLLPHYKKIIAMDCDIIVKRDLSFLYAEDISKVAMGAVQDYTYGAMLNGVFDADPERKYAKKVLKMKNPYAYVNTGVLLLNLPYIRKLYSKDQVISFCQKQKFHFQEQDAMNVLFEGNIKFLDLRWNCTVSMNPSTIRAMDNFCSEDVAKHIKKNAFLIHYYTHPKPWFFPTSILAEEWWTYAKQTPFYEELIAGMIDYRVGNVHYKTYDLQCRMGIFDTRTGARKFADKLLPPGSKRREFAKFLLPKGSLRWRFCKQIYYIFKPQYRPVKVKTDEDTED